MVRLVGLIFAAIACIVMFQFQCGAIGSIFSNSHTGYLNGFNSSVVRLVVKCLHARCNIVSSFNSSVVRLVGRKGCRLCHARTFQFQCGAIGSKEPMDFVKFNRFSFNSSVVRLVACMVHLAEPVRLFQFQCGAIGRDNYSKKVDQVSMFQFQCGAIGRGTFPVGLETYSCFNSSVVRLVGHFRFC